MSAGCVQTKTRIVCDKLSIVRLDAQQGGEHFPQRITVSRDLDRCTTGKFNFDPTRIHDGDRHEGQLGLFRESSPPTVERILRRFLSSTKL